MSKELTDLEKSLQAAKKQFVSSAKKTKRDLDRQRKKLVAEES